jgi:hypothetical protein
MLAADGGLLIGSRYAKVLVFSATLTAAMVVRLLAFATLARADVNCQGPFWLERTVTPDPAEVGEPSPFLSEHFVPLVVAQGSLPMG